MMMYMHASEGEPPRRTACAAVTVDEPDPGAENDRFGDVQDFFAREEAAQLAVLRGVPSCVRDGVAPGPPRSRGTVLVPLHHRICGVPHRCEAHCTPADRATLHTAQKATMLAWRHSCLGGRPMRFTLEHCLGAILLVAATGCGPDPSTSTDVGSQAGGQAGSGGGTGGGAAGSGGAGSPSTGGAGGGGCAPLTVVECYSGPDGTAGIGICEQGQKQCNADSTEYGPCEGEVLPAVEDSTTPADEDCNGTPGGPGTTVWGKALVASSSAGVQAVAVNAAGHVIVAGFFAGTADVGTPLVSKGGFDAFVAELDGDGNTLWARQLGGSETDEVTDLALDAAGNIFVAGTFAGTADFGGGPVQSAGAKDIFLVKLDAAGNHVLDKRFGGPQNDEAWIAVSPAGDIFLAGNAQGTIDLGNGPLVPENFVQIIVAGLDPNATSLWSKGFGHSAQDLAGGAAMDAAGNPIVVGSASVGVDFGGGPTDKAGPFVTSFAPDGGYLWSRVYGSPFAENHGVAQDGAGNLFLTGHFYSDLDFGGGPLTSAGGEDVFLAKLDSDADHVYSRSFGGAQSQVARAVTADPDGNAIIAGVMQGTADFGGGPYSSAGGSDVFVAAFGPDGASLWSRRFGGSGLDFGADVASDAAGNVIMAGTFSGTVDFGAGTLSSAGAFSAFVVKLAPR